MQPSKRICVKSLVVWGIYVGAHTALESYYIITTSGTFPLAALWNSRSYSHLCRLLLLQQARGACLFLPKMQSLYDREELYVQSLEGDIGQRAMAFLHHCYMSSTSSLPSNSSYTMSNIPGAGRIIDKFIYSKGGRLLQGAMDRFAHRMGMGPIACAQRIEKLLQYRRVQKLYLIFMEEPLTGFRQGVADEEDIQMISKECLKLVNFVMYVPSRNSSIYPHSLIF